MLTPKQEQTILNKARFKVLNWGRRSGKTTVFAYEALGTALSQDKAQVTYYAQTFDDARSIAWDIFLEVFGEAVINKNESRLEITLRNIHGGESYVSLKGWESVYTAGKGRGTENDLLLCDEVAFCRGFIDRYEKVLEPTLLTTKGRAVFGSTPQGFNDFYILTQRATNLPDWSYSHATSYDNPFNDPKELDRIKATKEDDVWAQEYLADFRQRKGLVHREFSRAWHVTDKLPNPVTVYETLMAVDFGFNAPCAILTIQRDMTDTYWVTEEFYKTGQTEENMIAYLRQKQFNKLFADPAGATHIEAFRRAGFNVMEVVKGKGSIIGGISKVNMLLRNNKIKIHTSCVNTIFEFETYCYPDKIDLRNPSELPIDENNHALDALRYVVNGTSSSGTLITSPQTRFFDANEDAYAPDFI